MKQTHTQTRLVKWFKIYFPPSHHLLGEGEVADFRDCSIFEFQGITQRDRKCTVHMGPIPVYGVQCLVCFVEWKDSNSLSFPGAHSKNSISHESPPGTKQISWKVAQQSNFSSVDKAPRWIIPLANTELNVTELCWIVGPSVFSASGPFRSPSENDTISRCLGAGSCLYQR